MSKRNSFWGANFVELAQKKGFLVKKATSHEFSRFINFILVGKSADGKPQSVSVSLKPSLNKKGNLWAWIEIKNKKGKPGWLYGDAHFIVFEFSDSFFLIKRKDLLEYINVNVDFNSPIVQHSWAAKYKLFQRPSHLDQITKINLSKLNPDTVEFSIWKK